MVNRVDGLGVRIHIHEVVSGPVSLSLCIRARLVLLDSFPAFLLSMPLDFAEVAEFPVLVVVTSVV